MTDICKIGLKKQYTGWEKINMNLDKITSELIVLNEIGNTKDSEDTIEPSEYFKSLKGKLNKTESEKLENSLSYLLSLIENAKRAGQTKLLESIHLNSRMILNELKLNALGIDSYVYREDLKTFVDKVTPKNSVKIIELERYPRIIPDDIVTIIEKVKSLKLFDKYCVLFTDFTGKSYQTDEERKLVERNRDPIIFGYFEDEKSKVKGDRFYVIADWEDEYCDLTLEKLAERMGEEKIGKGVVEIGSTKELILDACKLLAEPKPKESFFSRIFNKLFGG